MYDVIAAPPSSAGAVHDTDADALPAKAVTPTGAEGATACGETFGGPISPNSSLLESVTEETEGPQHETAISVVSAQ